MGNEEKYRSLHRVNWTPNWVFRRYSSAKQAEFVKSTGIPATDANRARAYQEGVRLFDKWVGARLPTGRQILIRDILRVLKESKAIKKERKAKEGKKDNTYRCFANQADNHVGPAFGHLRPDQITPLKWDRYDAEERRKGKRTRLFNTRKVLLEVLNRAKDEKIIDSVPDLKNFDPPPEPPRYIPRTTYLRIRRRFGKKGRKIRLLAFIMYRQGARPSEILQYRLSMIDWAMGMINIPGEITKTGRTRTIPLNEGVLRVLKWLRDNYLEGDCVFPSRYDPNRPLSAYNAVWDRAMDGLGLDYTIYNFRDTFITNKLKQGFSSVFIGRYCDTSSKMIEKKYAVAEEEVMRRIAE